MPYRLPALWTVLAMGVFSASHALSKINLQILPPQEVLGITNTFGFLITLFVLGLRGQWSLLRVRQRGWVGARLLTALIETHGVNGALGLLPLATFSTLTASLPLFTLVFAWFFLREKLSGRQMVLALVGFCGVVIALRPDSAGSYQGVTYALMAATAGACGTVILRHIGGRENFQTLVLYTLGTVGAVNLVWAVPGWVWPPFLNWVYLALTGLAFYVGNLLVTRALQKAPAGLLSTLRYTSFIWASIFGWLFFRHLPDAYTLAGIALIATSGILLVKGPKPA